MGLGGIINFVVEFRDRNRKKIHTYAERAIGWLWAICGGVMFFIPPYYHLLIMAITIIPAYLVPGYILRYNYKQV